jgi:uncharacterized membrane protein YgcG
MLLVVVMAIGFGAIAALLAAPPPTQAPSNAGPPPSPPFLSFSTGVAIFGGAVLVLLFGWMALQLYRRLRGETVLPLQFAVRLLAVILLFLVALVLLHYAQPGSGFGTVTNGTLHGQNGTGGTGGSAANNSTGNGTLFGPFHPIPGLSIPVWWVYVGLLVAAGVAAAVLYPYFAARRSEPETETEPPTPESRRAVADALAALEADPRADPRAVIVALYARLLAQVAPRLGDLDGYTPREIEGVAVATLGLRADTARELTALFEEARYSTHPMNARDSARARLALGRALAQMGAAGPAGPSPGVGAPSGFERREEATAK